MFKLALMPFLLASAAGGDQSLLDALSLELESTRSKSTVAPIVCPPRLDSLVGVSAETVTSKLGNPDLNETGVDENSQPTVVHQYVFANSDAPWIGLAVPTGEYTAVMPLGDPFSVLQLHYNADGFLVHALCDSR